MKLTKHHNFQPFYRFLYFIFYLFFYTFIMHYTLSQFFIIRILKKPLLLLVSCCLINLFLISLLQIRAANLSGDCFFWKENFGRFRFGWKAHQQVRLQISRWWPFLPIPAHCQLVFKYVTTSLYSGLEIYNGHVAFAVEALGHCHRAHKIIHY